MDPLVTRTIILYTIIRWKVDARESCVFCILIAVFRMAIYVCRYDIGVNEKNFTVDNAKRNDQYFKNTLYAR